MYKIIQTNNDISEDEKKYIINNLDYISIDTETTGLNPLNDDLCIIQLFSFDKIFIVKYEKEKSYKNIVEILESNKIIKIFHHANFDLRFLMRNLNCINARNIVCTKIAAKLIRGDEKTNSLKELVKVYLGVELDKSEQLSNWSKEILSKEQIEYAIKDTLYLMPLWKLLKEELKSNNLSDIANSCYSFLPTNALLQNQGFKNIFNY